MAEVIKTTKRAARSKTIWFGLALVVFGFLQTQHGPIDLILPPDIQGWLDMIIGLCVVVLRFWTSEALINDGTE
jgi:hypothetical protein